MLWKTKAQGEQKWQEEKEDSGGGWKVCLKTHRPLRVRRKVETLPLREIEPDPDQPRKTFDQQALGELAASIAEHGLLQPIAVRPQPGAATASWPVSAGGVPAAWRA